jgi:hypothetical protein
VINISSVTVRTFYPQARQMHVTAWALGPVEGARAPARAARCIPHLLRPRRSHATPTMSGANWCRGLASWHEDPGRNVARDGQNGEQLNSDGIARIFWRRWNALMGAEA